ncbi:MAG: bifunctional folylpolyglutamate synthase/dihydrofolate synthase [Rhodoluna sp.]|nr:bifunctional folylpolyglutamate synthase/dihydrofolate synthase [Rhodoluna sp.]
MSTESYWATKADEVMNALLTRIPENKLRPRLEPTRRAVELLGDPQKSYRVIHVTGTNGKTTTTRIIERILRELGLRTGRFTSPHLVRLNERMAIDGEPVGDQQLAEVWADIEPILAMVDAELEAAGDTKLTFFEALAVLGFAVFADAPVDVLVLEVGMGGEWDSTNVADGDVAVFTPISIDHAERLGDTVAEIAKTKSGIIKPGAIVVSSEQPAEALAVLEAKTAQVAERIAVYGRDFEILDVEPDVAGQRFSVKTLTSDYRDLFLPLHGEYQAENAALAISAVEAFFGVSNRLFDDVLRVAIADSTSPGRLQVVSRKPLTILDAAHNPGGAESLARAMKKTFGAPKTIAVISILGDKDAHSLLQALNTTAETFVVTQSTSPRAIEVNELEKIAKEIFGESRVRSAETPYRALELAKELVVENGAIVVTGSITLVGDVLKNIQLGSDDNESEDYEN